MKFKQKKKQTLFSGCTLDSDALDCLFFVCFEEATTFLALLFKTSLCFKEKGSVFTVTYIREAVTKL